MNTEITLKPFYQKKTSRVEWLSLKNFCVFQVWFSLHLASFQWVRAILPQGLPQMPMWSQSSRKNTKTQQNSGSKKQLSLRVSANLGRYSPFDFLAALEASELCSAVFLQFARTNKAFRKKDCRHLFL